MDNFNSGKTGNPNSEKPIPIDDVETSPKGISHSPLDLGGSHPVEVKKTQQAVPKPVSVSNVASKSVSSGRITGLKTFFTKLHPGALNFLDDQINEWLKKNPNVDIKHTNIAVGEVQSKKTEQNIIITIWY